jgi:hypothetical protein
MSSRINYIKNPTFKDGIKTFWASVGAGASIDSVDEIAHLGDYSLRVTKANGVANCGARIDTYRIPVTAGSTYTLSAYVRMPRELESRNYTCQIDWYASESAPTAIGSTTNTIEIFGFQVSGLGFLSVFATGEAPFDPSTGAPSTHATISIYQVESEANASSQPYRYFFIDSVMFEESPYVNGFFESLTQDQETTTVNKSLSPVPYPEITGMELNADITLNGLLFNTIDESGVLWVCTGLEGWWGQAEPEVPDIPRGLGDGSYDVRGRYASRQIEFSGVFLPPNREMVAEAREKLITAIDLVKTRGWLIVDEEPSRASLVRLVDRPQITTVNARGRTEFSFTLRAYDPVKYEWIYGDESGRNYEQVEVNDSFPFVNQGNSPVSVVFELHGPMEVGTYIRNLANQQTITLAKRLRGPQETTPILKITRAAGETTITTNSSPSIGLADFISVSGIGNDFDVENVQPLSVIDDNVSDTYQITYSNDFDDFGKYLVNFKELTNNIAILTTSSNHELAVNNVIYVSGIDTVFDGTYNVTAETSNTISYYRENANVVGVAVTDEDAFVEYGAPEGSVVGLFEEDILEIDTYLQEVTLNGTTTGNRFYLETLVDWIYFEPGTNSVEIVDNETLSAEPGYVGDIPNVVIYYRSGWLG